MKEQIDLQIGAIKEFLATLDINVARMNDDSLQEYDKKLAKQFALSATRNITSCSEYIHSLLLQ